jgi:hypothetical protein
MVIFPSCHSSNIVSFDWFVLHSISLEINLFMGTACSALQYKHLFAIPNTSKKKVATSDILKKKMMRYIIIIIIIIVLLLL